MGRKLAVLEIDRPLEKGENPASEILAQYREKFDLIVFPWREDKLYTEVIFFNNDLLHDFEVIFLSHIEWTEAGGDSFFDLELAGVRRQTFYNVLGKMFAFDTFNLTKVESN